MEVAGNPVRVLTAGLEERSGGRPVFVLQAGAASPLDAWDHRWVDSISQLAPVVAYDRPGLGGSRFDGHDPTPEHIAHHLQAVLDVLGVQPPYVLIGHSWGGPLILQHAALYPSHVAGLLYVDPSHPHRELDVPEDPVERARVLAELDALRAGPSDWPEGQRAEARVTAGFWSTPASQRGVPPHPDVPTAVVLGTFVDDVPAGERAAARALQDRRVEEVRAWLRDVTRLHFVVAPHATHFVHWDDPDLVTDAARRVLDWVTVQTMRIDHVHLLGPRGGEDAARAFYGGVLGMQEIPKPPALQSRGGCWFRSGECEVHIGMDPDFRPQRKAHPCFVVADLRALAQRCEESGAEIEWDDRIEGVRRFFTHDPFGNRIELRD